MTRDFQLDSADNVVAVFGSDPGSGNPPAAWFSRAYQPARRGGIESGVAKLEADGSQVVWATWFGGTGDDSSEVGVCVDAQDRVCITGNTIQRVEGGGVDAVLLRLKADFSELLYSTFVGGPGDDRFRSGCLGRDASLYGIGTSSDAGFPVRNAAQPVFAGGGGVGDAVVVKLSPQTAERKATTSTESSPGPATILRDRFGEITRIVPAARSRPARRSSQSRPGPWSSCGSRAVRWEHG